MNYYERLQLYRKDKNISQKDMANVIDKKPSDISDYENGKRSMYAKDLNKIILHYQINPVWLFLGKGPQELTDGDLLVQQFQDKKGTYQPKSIALEVQFLKNKYEALHLRLQAQAERLDQLELAQTKLLHQKK